jgi:tetratricopeptide (TPR) repeat protein
MNQSSDLTIIYCCSGEPNLLELEGNKEICGQLIIVCKHKYAYELAYERFQVVGWVPEEGKVSAMNKAARQAKGGHILWLEEGERLFEIPDLSKNTCYKARVIDDESEGPVHNWQVRLFPNVFPGDAPFSGFDIPEIYSTFVRLNWKQADIDITIQRKSALFTPNVIRQEIEAEAGSATHDFWAGMLAAENDNFNSAISCFKDALNYKSEMAPWNKLAAFNGLANALVETQQLQKAKRCAEKSLELSPNQRAPYLMLYQYYSTRGKPEKACEMLDRYRKVMGGITEANWDVYLPESQAVFLMAEISFRSGWHEKAYRHYEDFFAFNDGQVSQAVLEKLFIYAVELQHRTKAMRYFRAIFGSDYTTEFDEGTSQRISEALSLFADKGWHDFTSDIYGKLLDHRPEDENLRRSCMQALIKNDQLKKAQALL